jgi:hypothetical protein
MILAAATAAGSSACDEGGDLAPAASGTDLRPRATLIALRGAVTVKRAAGDAWTAAAEGMELFENDKLRTARGASAQVRFESGSALTVSEDALVGIAEPRPRAGRERSDLTVLKGRIDAELADPQNHSLVVTTPSATVRAGREIVFQ